MRRGRPDAVEHPAHYAGAGGIECIDAMASALGGELLGYLWGNAFKYLWRWRRKGGVEDLRKCRWYIDRLIDRCGPGNGARGPERGKS